MIKLPNYIGSSVFGIKMGVILPGCDLPALVLEALRKVDKDSFLSNGDMVCITESVVARSQNNYVTISEIAEEIRGKCSLSPEQKIGVLFPITSRNRFALILEGIAEAVCEGEVVVQLSYPVDEVGNQIIPLEVAEELERKLGGCITPENLSKSYPHPLTGVDYIKLYRQIIIQKGARPTIFLCNDPLRILNHNPDVVIVSDIHHREKTRRKIVPYNKNVITLQDLFVSDEKSVWSEWGLLGSNMSSSKKLKLAPRQGDEFAVQLQELIFRELGKKVEIIVYGDGAYKDPSSGIYELADPCSAFGVTPKIKNMLRTGIKLKYLIDLHHENGKTEEEIQKILEKEVAKERELHCMESEGTTPRRLIDILATLADLVSGSADAGTPLILVKGILSVFSSL